MDRRTMVAAALALGGAAAVLGHAGRAEAATTSISSCPYTIAAPGTYVPTKDLTCPGADATTVTADGVRLVLGRHTITGNGSGAGPASSRRAPAPIP